MTTCNNHIINNSFLKANKQALRKAGIKNTFSLENKHNQNLIMVTT